MYDEVWATYAEPLFGASLGIRRLRVHPKGTCLGEFCAIHNPSAHPLREAPLTYRADKGIMERVCTHGVGHPDPDSMEYLRLSEQLTSESLLVHGCDGCCFAEEGLSDEAS